MTIPGINVITVADFVGELGPIGFYANANAITGRAALMPSRYQSDAVNHANGPLRRSGNRRLRAILMNCADHLVKNNNYFRARAALWENRDKDARWIRVKVVKILSRLGYAMVAGRQIFPHPCCQPRHYILDKLLCFHDACDTPVSQRQQDLQAAIAQLPKSRYIEEAKPLQEQLDDLNRRKRGPQPLADILPLVLAKLGLHQVKSAEEGEDPSSSPGPENR